MHSDIKDPTNLYKDVPDEQIRFTAKSQLIKERGVAVSRRRPRQGEGRVREGQVQATRDIHSVAQPAVLSA